MYIHILIKRILVQYFFFLSNIDMICLTNYQLHKNIYRFYNHINNRIMQLYKHIFITTLTYIYYFYNYINNLFMDRNLVVYHKIHYLHFSQQNHRTSKNSQLVGNHFLKISCYFSPNINYVIKSLETKHCSFTLSHLITLLLKEMNKRS